MDKKIKFSVVMPVYNREKYLKEAVDSIIMQTYGFKNIELILVDDGSTDGSGEICDKYQLRFPENCKVIHQENQGASAARKAGVELSTGEWINFLDSDDKLEKNAFKEVAKFVKKYADKTDVIAIPIYYFGARKGIHNLNYKFSGGNRVIDLEKEWDKPQLSLSSTFVKAEIIKKVAFKGDISLLVAEDAKELQYILLEKKTLGVLKSTKYWYRKHKNSVLNNAVNDSRWYTISLKCFSQDVLKYAKEKCGQIPKFVQFAVMYDLQWKINQKEIPEGVLSLEEKEEYKKILTAVCNQIDVDVILKQKNIWREQKYYLIAGRQCNIDKIDFFNLSEIPLRLDFVEILENKIHLEGWIPKYMYDSRNNIELYAELNGDKINAELKKGFGESYFFDNKLFEQYSFNIDLNLTDKIKNKLSFYVKHDNQYYCLNHVAIGQFVPLDSNSRFSYKKFSEWILQKKENVLFVEKYKRLYPYELCYLTDIFMQNRDGSKKAIIVRAAYKFIKILSHKEIWLISDRITKANDNGEALFRYIMKNRNKSIKVYFVVSKDSPDYKRMKNFGPVVSSFSIKHRLLYLLSSYNISSHADRFVCTPFYGYEKAYRSLNMPKFVFLQHGVTKDDLSSWLKRPNKNIFGFVTTTVPEYNSIIGDMYGYTDKEVWLTGFCRFDNLENHPQKIILITPTWRNYLLGETEPYTGLRKPIPEFKESDYYFFYNQLINDKRLLDCLAIHNYRLKYVPHPAIMSFIDLFDKQQEVEFAKDTDSYSEMFADSDLMVTDYSSTAFDFAYLKKPVLYCQFDKDIFFGGKHSYKKGYFDYERDGFGEVEYTLEDTINRIIEYVENDCKLKPEYEERIDNTFAFHDRNNCKRVYDKLIEMRN